MYTVLGLSDTGNVELADHHTEGQCYDWIYEYTRFGDFGGYDAFAVIDPEGEWVTVHEPFEQYFGR